MAAKNEGASYLARMQERADVQGKEEGKFVDQVAAKNEGASYLAVYVWTRRSFVQYLVHHSGYSCKET